MVQLWLWTMVGRHSKFGQIEEKKREKEKEKESRSGEGEPSGENGSLCLIV
jgi:hypothetical protein